MHKIFSTIKEWLREMIAPAPPADPLLTMSQRDLADLPVYHPLAERSAGCQA